MAGFAGMGNPQAIQSDIPQSQPVQAMPVQTPVADQAAQTPPPPAKPSLDDIFGAQASQKPSLDDIFGGSEMDTSDVRGQGTLESLKQQAAQFPQRLKASFAVTDKEKQASLEGSYGKDNVKKIDGDLYYRSSDTGNKWRSFEAKGKLETIGDIAQKLGRPAVEAVGTSMGTAAGLAAAGGEAIAAPETAGASLAAIPSTIVASRAAGGAFGLATADAIQQALGIPIDKDRNRALEYGVAATLNPIAGKLGDYVSGKIDAKAAATQAEKLMPPEQLFSKEVQGLADDSKFLQDKGLLTNIPGTDTPLMLHQLNPSNEGAQAIAKTAAMNPQFQQFSELQQQGFDKASHEFMNGVAKLTSENIDSAKSFVDYTKALHKADGEFIGSIRDNLIKASGDGELPVPKLSGQLKDISSKLGFSYDATSKTPSIPSVQELVEKGFEAKDAEVLVSKIGKLNQTLINSSDRLPADKLIGAYNEWNGLYGNLVTKGQNVDPLYKSVVGQVRRGIRDEIVDKAGTILSPADQAKYSEKLAQFSQNSAAQDQLARLLDKDQVSSYNFAKSIFSKGANSLSDIAAAKTLTANNPEIWNTLVGQKVGDVMAQHYDSVTRTTNWAKVYGDLQKLGPEVVKQMFNTDDMKSLQAMTNVAKTIENSSATSYTPQAKISLIKNIMLSPFSKFARANVAASLISQVDKDKALAQVLTKNGIDDFLKGAPSSNKPVLKRIFNTYLNMQNKTGTLGGQVIMQGGRELRPMMEQPEPPQQ